MKRYCDQETRSKKKLAHGLSHKLVTGEVDGPERGHPEEARNSPSEQPEGPFMVQDGERDDGNRSRLSLKSYHHPRLDHVERSRHDSG